MSACPRCKTSYSGGARICRNCGGALEAPKPEAAPGVEAIPRSVGLRTCSRCGRCVPLTRERCVVCSGTSTQVVSPRDDGATWVRVSGDFRCTACSEWVMLRGFAEDGQSICGACGHHQSHPIIFWRTLLELARKALPLDDAVATERVRDDEDLPRDMVAVVGHPRCVGCATPIGSTWPNHTACMSCGLSTTVARPPIAMRVNRALVAIMPESSQVPRPEPSLCVVPRAMAR